MVLNRTLRSRLARVLALLSVLVLPPVSTRAEEPRVPPQSAEAKARERAALDSAFKSLEEELKALIGDYSKAVQEASKQGLPREKWPRSPANDLYPRFESLALQDQPDALRWCLGISSSLDLPMDARLSKRDALYKRFVTTALDTTFTPDIISFLSLEAAPDGLGVERAADFLDKIKKGASKAEVRSQAAWAQAQVYQKGKKPEHKDLAIATYKELVSAYPKSNEAGPARGIVFQLEHLQIGMTAPDVATSDVDGKEFKLSDTRGKATVLFFFAFGHRATPQMLTQFKEVAAHFKDKPLAWVGVTLDEKQEDFKKSLAEAGIDWKISWQGGRNGPWVSEWGVARLPAIYVLDDKGVIRQINVEKAELSKGLEAIFAEIEARSKPAK